MIFCKYTGTFQDYSGVGDSNRSDIMSLFVNGVGIQTELLVQVPESVDHGIPGEIARRLQDNKVSYKIKILHITPDLIPKYKEQGIYHIARVAWETDKLPSVWVAGLNEVDEVWTMCPSTEKAMRASGVTKPIFVFPEAVDIIKGEEKIRPFELKHNKDFYFYSMFQWIERKNPRGLLRAYFRAFEGRDDVTLILKTYRVFYLPDEFDLIKQDIAQLKQELGLKHYPKIYLVKDLLTEEERWKLHQLADCYISASSGEGWGRPMQEVMLLGKPVISASNGGITDFMDLLDYYQIPTTLSPVVQQNHIPWYTSDQNWLLIDEYKLEKAMKEVFANYSKAQEKANKAKEFVMKNFSYQIVGRQMVERLNHIL